MEIEIQPNPNCEGTDQFHFNEIGSHRRVRAIRVSSGKEDTACDVVGVDEGGRFVDAKAVKVTDSGAGHAWLIYGGVWGIRMRPSSRADEPWDLSNRRQWGEPFKVYGEAKDIFFADQVVTKNFARTVIFDGDCGFCTRWVRWGKRLDWLGRIEWRARLEPGLAEKYPQITREGSLNQMISIPPDGKSLGGFYAVRDILVHLPLTFLPALLFYVPGASWVGVPVYKWVAKNRHRLGKQCEI